MAASVRCRAYKWNEHIRMISFVHVMNQMSVAVAWSSMLYVFIMLLLQEQSQKYDGECMENSGASRILENETGRREPSRNDNKGIFLVSRV